MTSKITSALVGKMIKVYVADTTSIVKEAKEVHKTSPLATDALGRALTASSILGKMLKNERDSLTFKISGTNQIKTVLVTTSYSGNVKGYISEPDAQMPLKSGKMDVANAIGRKGTLTLIRDLRLKEPYVGISSLVSGEIDKDLAYYFINSEQQPTEIALATEFDGDDVIAAGGIFIQVIPGICSEEEKLIEYASKRIFNIAELIKNGLTAEEIIKHYFVDAEVSVLGEYEVEYKCDCSIDRITKALITIGIDDLTEIMNNDKGAELTCHFCNKRYEFSESDLKDIIEALKK